MPSQCAVKFVYVLLIEQERWNKNLLIYITQYNYKFAKQGHIDQYPTCKGEKV